MACCDLLLVRCRRLQRSAKCKYTHYRSTYCFGIRGTDVTVWDSDPWKSRVWAFARKREITEEPLNSRSQILDPKWREITGVDCIFVSKPTIIGSDNGLSPGWRQAIIWTSAEIFIIGSLATNFNEILIKLYIFSYKEIHLNMSSGNSRPFCLGLNVFNHGPLPLEMLTISS